MSHAAKGISDTQKRRNRAIATPRARVEHVFGALAQMGQLQPQAPRLFAHVQADTVTPRTGGIRNRAPRIIDSWPRSAEKPSGKPVNRSHENAFVAFNL
jgi:hypothetical protein